MWINSTFLASGKKTQLKPEQGWVGADPDPEKTVQAKKTGIGKMEQGGNA